MRRHDTYVGLIRSTVVVVAMLMGAPALAADSKTTPTPTVSLTQAVHFLDAKGLDLVVGPGEYRVEVARKSGLTLTPTDGSNPIVLSGSSVTLETPAAFSVPMSNDEYHLLLLLPNGKGVDALGSPSGVRSRTDVTTPFTRPITLTICCATVTPLPKEPINRASRYIPGVSNPPK